MAKYHSKPLGKKLGKCCMGSHTVFLSASYLWTFNIYLLIRLVVVLRSFFSKLFATHRISHRRSFIEKAVFKNYAIFIWKHLCWSVFLIGLLGPHVFSCEHYEIFKNTYFEEHLEWLRLYLHGSQRPAENLVK